VERDLPEASNLPLDAATPAEGEPAPATVVPAEEAPPPETPAQAPPPAASEEPSVNAL
jgi:hypothetical protein